MANNAKIIDPNLLIQAGINPKTGLPIKYCDNNGSALKDAYSKCFRIKDEQDAINRFVWTGLPNGLNSRLIERVLYYRGQGMFFFMKENMQFYFLPYALNGSIDVYGRFTSVTPLPFNGKTSTKDKDGKEKAWITGLIRIPLYDLPINGVDADIFENGCVLLKDYSEQISQTNISRQILQDPIIQHMAEIPCFARTALLNNTGVMGMKVQNQDEASQVYSASNGINEAAITGQKYIPIIGSVDFQELTGSNVAKAEEFLVTLESLDNLRLSFYGIPNGGIFQKKAHMLETEAQLNAGAADLALQDGLNYRKEFATLVNSIWELGINCEINPSLLGTSMMVGDFDGDGKPGMDDVSDVNVKEEEINE